MKVKDIELGVSYKLNSRIASTVGCASKAFSLFMNKEIIALKKLHNYKANNDVFVQGFDEIGNSLYSFWCSAFDLREVKKVIPNGI
jgi:hypothetical protein